MCDVFRDVGGVPVLVAVVSDGAGSASRSVYGSQLACHACVAQLEEWLSASSSVSDMSRDDILEIFQNIQHQLLQQSIDEGIELRQFACTLLLAIITPSLAWFAQIGDGAIVILTDGKYVPVFWPQEGQYVNMTHFVTDENLDQIFLFSKHEGCVDEVALFSDGIQRLALTFQDQGAHQQFFQPLFQHMRSAPVGFLDSLTTQLAEFLDSAAVNERTDDDKSLVLATRVSNGTAISESA